MLVSPPAPPRAGIPPHLEPPLTPLHTPPRRRKRQTLRTGRGALIALLSAGVVASGAGLAVDVAAPAAAGTAPATTTVTLAATADTYVVKSQPTAVKGSASYAYASTGENRGFIKFPTRTVVPAGKKLVAAELRLFVRNRALADAGVELHPTTSTWSESTLTAANRPEYVATAVSQPVAVPAKDAWLSVPLADLSGISNAADTAYEVKHTVSFSSFMYGTREAGQAPELVLTLADLVKPQTPGLRPFDMPTASALSGSPRLVFAHYFTPFPISIDNKSPDVDYYTRNYLAPTGESGQHAAYGGLLRDRPIGRSPLTGAWQDADIENEIRQARTAGLDGFTVDLLSLTSYHWDRVVSLLNAAHRVDPSFKIMLMPDMTTLNSQPSATLAASIATLAAYPAAFKLPDGRLVVSPFKAENQTAAWWATWITTMKTKHGITTAFVPTLLDWKKYASSFSSISYGFSQWGLSNPGSNTGNPANAIQAHSMGKIWMAPTHVQDERPNQGIFDEAANTETLRLSWDGVINSTTDWVDIPTWNDYSEGTHIAPSAKHGYSYLDLMSYYITWWKTGQAPTVVRDGLYLTHRTQPFAAKPLLAQTKLMTLRANTTPARDTVEAVAFLIDPATVTVKVGSHTYTWDAPAGMSTKNFPLATGQVSGSVTRFGAVTTQVTSPFTVTTTPSVQDLQYDAVSSLRQP